MFPFVLIENVLKCDCFNQMYALQALLFANTCKTFSSMTCVDLLKTKSRFWVLAHKAAIIFLVYLKIVNSVYMLLETEENRISWMDRN